MRIVVYFLFAFILLIGIAVLMAEVKRQSNSEKTASKVKPQSYILCEELTPTILENAKISTKNTTNGIKVIITSSDETTVRDIQNIVFTCQKRREKNFKVGKETELLLRPKVEVIAIFLNNGISLNLSSNIKSLIKKIHNISIPGHVKTPIKWKNK